MTLTGDDIGQVKDLIYDSSTGSIRCFTLAGRGLFAGPLHRAPPWERVGATNAAFAAGCEVETGERRRALLPVVGPVTVSNERLLVPDATAQHSAGDLAGFGTAVESLRTRFQHDQREG